MLFVSSGSRWCRRWTGRKVLRLPPIAMPRAARTDVYARRILEGQRSRASPRRSSGAPSARSQRAAPPCGSWRHASADTQSDEESK